MSSPTTGQLKEPIIDLRPNAPLTCCVPLMRDSLCTDNLGESVVRCSEMMT